MCSTPPLPANDCAKRWERLCKQLWYFATFIMSMRGPKKKLFLLQKIGAPRYDCDITVNMYMCTIHFTLFVKPILCFTKILDVTVYLELCFKQWFENFYHSKKVFTTEFPGASNRIANFFKLGQSFINYHVCNVHCTMCMHMVCISWAMSSLCHIAPVHNVLFIKKKLTSKYTFPWTKLVVVFFCLKTNRVLPFRYFDGWK